MVKNNTAVLRSINQQLLDRCTHYINVNNRLWNALAKLPGGIEVARKITLGNPRLPK